MVISCLLASRWKICDDLMRPPVSAGKNGRGATARIRSRSRLSGDETKVHLLS
jgi:hypothetical protein